MSAIINRDSITSEYNCDVDEEIEEHQDDTRTFTSTISEMDEEEVYDGECDEDSNDNDDDIDSDIRKDLSHMFNDADVDFEVVTESDDSDNDDNDDNEKERKWKIAYKTGQIKREGRDKYDMEHTPRKLAHTASLFISNSNNYSINGISRSGGDRTVAFSVNAFTNSHSMRRSTALGVKTDATDVSGRVQYPHQQNTLNDLKEIKLFRERSWNDLKQNLKLPKIKSISLCSVPEERVDQECMEVLDTGSFDIQYHSASSSFSSAASLPVNSPDACNSNNKIMSRDIGNSYPRKLSNPRIAQILKMEKITTLPLVRHSMNRPADQ